MAISQCLQPKYVEAFQCDGSQCNAHCCRGWRVNIDEATHAKYRRMPNRKLAKELMDCLVPLADNPHMYGVRLKPNATCPMLTEERLCRIQRECGEDFLSDVCRRFPRFVMVCGDVLMCTLSLTCPLAARLALTPREPIRLELVPIAKQYHTEVYDLTAMPARRYWRELLTGNLSILQRRALSIDARLAILGDYWSAVDAELNAQTDSLAGMASLREHCATMPPPSFAFHIGECVQGFFALMEQLHDRLSVYLCPDGRAFSHVKPIGEAFGLASGARTLRGLALRYRDARLAFERYVVEPHGFMLENYLVNECLVNLYPGLSYGDVALNYRVFVVLYKFMETVLMAEAVNRGAALTDEDILTVMAWMAQMTDHNPQVVATVAELVRENPLTLEHFMSTWLLVG